jgi:unsaturated rhamnogalacturonyl hydrolase
MKYYVSAAARQGVGTKEAPFPTIQQAADVARKFNNVRKYLYVPEKGLYVHACDMAKQQPWADPETGKSPNFWLRSMGWYLMALADCLELMDPMLYEHWRALKDLFVEAMAGILRWRDAETGLFYQVIDHPEAEGNYLETSGTSMVLYAILKGCRLGLMDEALKPGALEAMRQLTARYLRVDENGQYHLGGICKVAGLGPASNPVRDGSVRYYLSEPIVEDDAKGTGPYMMAVSETLRG